MPAPATEFESLLEAVPDALVGVDRSGQIRFADQLAESLFGYDRGELVGLALDLLVPESARRAHEAHREGYDAAPSTRPIGTDLNLTGLRRDGTEIPVDIGLSSSGSGDGLRVIAAVRDRGKAENYPLTLRHRNGNGARTEILYNASLYRDTDGNVLGVFASAHDVTKQVQAQKKLTEQQARELERLAELERFQRLTVGRELKMIELKKQIEYLKKNGPAGGGER